MALPFWTTLRTKALNYANYAPSPGTPKIPLIKEYTLNHIGVPTII